MMEIVITSVVAASCTALGAVACWVMVADEIKYLKARLAHREQADARANAAKSTVARD